MSAGDVLVRRATPDDAAAAAHVLNTVIAERRYTLFTQPFSIEEERRFIASLDDRRALYLAEMPGGTVVGVQSVDLFVPFAESMRHVATIGTWLLPEARGRGVARALSECSIRFARTAGYEKVVIQVLACNHRALGFYRALGFTDIGVARRHVRLGDVLHDEIYLERLL